jgi:hypothetical protein
LVSYRFWELHWELDSRKKDDPLEEQKKFQLQQEWKAAKAAMAKAEQDTKKRYSCWHY